MTVLGGLGYAPKGETSDTGSWQEGSRLDVQEAADIATDMHCLWHGRPTEPMGGTGVEQKQGVKWGLLQSSALRELNRISGALGWERAFREQLAACVRMTLAGWIVGPISRGPC